MAMIDSEEVFNRLRVVECDIARHGERIDALENGQEKILKSVEDVKDSLVNRLPIWASLFIGGLMSLCTGLVVLILKH